MRAVAGIARATQRFVCFAAHFDIGGSPLPDIAALVQLAQRTGRLPFFYGWQPAPNETAVGNGFVEVHQDHRIVLAAFGIAAISPMFGRAMACGKDKLEILAIGDFAPVKRCSSKKVTGQEKRPEVAERRAMFPL